MQSQSIVIVGGGFAGTTLARALDGKLPAGCELVLVSEESYTTFHPMLPEALGASVFPEQVVAPIRAMLARARFIMGRVTALDPVRRTLACTTVAGDITLPYTQLVLAFGNRARLDLLPGLAKHALPLKTVGDAVHIRNVVLRRLARIELEDDACARRRLGRFIVLGGGFSGVECAGELADCLRGIRRYYPRVREDELSITLLHDLPRLLPELPQALGAAARRSLTERGVDVRTGVRARASALPACGSPMARSSRVRRSCARSARSRMRWRRARRCRSSAGASSSTPTLPCAAHPAYGRSAIAPMRAMRTTRR